MRASKILSILFIIYVIVQSILDYKVVMDIKVFILFLIAIFIKLYMVKITTLSKMIYNQG